MRRKAKPQPHSDLPCTIFGCVGTGDYKAPKSRYNTNDYQYLCLDHVREFNQAWNYFDGWSRTQIEDFMDATAHGHKPTWKIGTQPIFTDEHLRTSFFKMLGEEPPKTSKKPQTHIPRKIRDALTILDLESDANITTIKAQYKKLVKKYHPDVNKNCKIAEETFKDITNAYKILCQSLGK